MVETRKIIKQQIREYLKDSGDIKTVEALLKTSDIGILKSIRDSLYMYPILDEENENENVLL